MNKRTTLNWLFGAFAMFLSGTVSAQTYCTTVGPSSTADTEIRDVYLLGDNYGISNPTTCPTVSGLRDFTQVDSADVSLGTSYSLEALMSTCGGVYGAFARAWIDFNADGDFDDAGEELGTWSGSPAASGSTVRNAFMSFTVPLTATLGRTRIRVMLHEGGSTTATTPCATFTWGAAHDYTIRVTNTPPACPIPGQLAVSGVTSTQASLTWTSTGTAFDIEYGPAGYTQGAGTSLTSTTANATLTGLSANTCYDVYVRNNCSASNNGTSSWSGPLNFCTSCATLTLPTTETFGTFPPNCWSVNTGSVPWTSYTTGGVTHARAAFYSNNDDSFILESAPIDVSVPARVVIDWSHQANTSYPFDSMTVRVREINSSVWTNVLSRSGAAFNTPGATIFAPAPVLTHDIAYLPASFVGDTVVVQVYGWSDWGPDLFVDFVTIEAQPACPEPLQLSVPSTTDITANLAWQSSSSGFVVQWGLAGFSIGTGASDTVATNSAVATGLAPNTSYDFYVMSLCGTAGNSIWSGPFTFTTSCASFNLPAGYTENFDAYVAGDQPDCWITVNGSTFEIPAFPGTPAFSAPNFAEFDAGSNLASAVISPRFNDLDSGIAQVRFRASKIYSWSNVSLVVGASTSTNYAASFIALDTILLTQPWTEHIYRPNLPSGYEYLVLKTSAAFSSFGIDNFQYEAIPACPEPLQLGTSAVTDVSATFNWQSSASSFEVQWGPAGFTLGTGSSDTVSTNSAVVTGLAPNTAYEFYVMTLCGTTGTSIWSGPFGFTTLCAGFTLPTGYSENFDAYVVGDSPACWTPTGSVIFDIPAFASTTAYSAPNYAQMNAGSIMGSMLISPMFSDLDSGNAQIRFRANKLSTWSTTNLIVGLVSSTANPGSFVAIDTLALNFAWDEYSIPFPVVPAGYKHVAFRTMNTWNSLGIDDFNYEVQPACLPAVNGSASPTATNALISWSHGAVGTPGSTVVWGPAGFNPGTGTPSGSANVTGTTYTITGLTQNTAYTAWIADSCGSSSLAPWYGPINFTTSCLGTTMPYVENFDVSPLGCWDNSGGTTTMLQYSQGAGYAMRGNFWSWLAGEYAVMTSRSVSITAPARVSFDWSHMYMATYPDDQLLLLGRTSTATTWDTLVDLIGPSFTSPGAGNTIPGTFVDTIVNLPTSWIGSDAIFRFVAISDWGPDVFFDNFVVEAVPTCPQPIGGVVAGSVSPTTAGISWTSPGTPLGSNVMWGPAGFLSGGGTVGSTTVWNAANPYTITGLNPGQSYDVYVQDSCSSTDQSTWAGPYTITTALCLPANQCTSTMYMVDSWGDGWNGGVITAQQKISGAWVTVKDFTFATGDSAQDVVQFCDGDSVRIVVTSGGSFASEMGFDLVGPFGDTLSTMPFNSTLIAGSTWNSFVAQCTPCAVPTGLNAAGSTTCTSTTVTWTSSSSAVSTNLEYGPAGFTPGSGTSLTGLTGGTTNLTGLTPNTAYDVYVQDVCATGTSPWSSASAVTTANAPQPTVTTAYTVLSMNPVTIQFDATIANATAVSWSFSNGGSATGTSTVQSFGVNGPAFAVATVSNDCGTVSDTLNFTVGMGENALATLRVFPNPTTGLVRVEFPMQTSGTAMVRVLSITGAQLTATNAQLAAGTASVDLDLRGLASGLYLLEVQTEEATGVQRLVIER